MGQTGTRTDSESGAVGGAAKTASCRFQWLMAPGTQRDVPREHSLARRHQRMPMLPACLPVCLACVYCACSVHGVQGVEEDVGMLGVHLPDGEFVELVPWAGQVEWEADPWGRWQLWGRGRGYEALLEATCEPGAR